jgi:hypothetical protein
MNCLYPLPKECLAQLKNGAETGIGYQIVSVGLRDGRNFDQVVVSEGCIIEVKGYREIPFSVDEVASISVNHNRWNFRDGSDSRRTVRAACA